MADQTQQSRYIGALKVSELKHLEVLARLAAEGHIAFADDYTVALVGALTSRNKLGTLPDSSRSVVFHCQQKEARAARTISFVVTTKSPHYVWDQVYPLFERVEKLAVRVAA